MVVNVDIGAGGKEAHKVIGELIGHEYQHLVLQHWLSMPNMYIGALIRAKTRLEIRGITEVDLRWQRRQSAKDGGRIEEVHQEFEFTIFHRPDTQNMAVDYMVLVV